MLTPDVAHPDLVILWHLMNASVGEPGDFQQRIHELPNYDSLRHGFKRALGCSPRDMMLPLRLQHAKNLLLESSLSIKDIAQRCGYQRQHEFARAFRQQTGAAPTEWRVQPLARLSADAKSHSAAANDNRTVIRYGGCPLVSLPPSTPRFIDPSHPLAHGAPAFPNDPTVSLRPRGAIAREADNVCQP